MAITPKIFDSTGNTEYNDLQAYFTAIGTTELKTVYISGPVTLLQNTVQTSNIKLEFVNDGRIITSEYSYTCNGTHNDVNRQIWNTSGGGSVVYTSNQGYVRPEWFGSTKDSLIRAINSLPSTGGNIKLIRSDYNIVDSWACSSTPGAAIGNEKQNVKIFGAGMPIKSADASRFTSGSGTVIQGSVINFADGFEIYDCGVDCGSYVVDNLSEDTWLDGFIPGTHKLNSEWDDYDSYIKGVSFGNIKVLMKRGANLYGHGCLIEHIDQCTHGYVEVSGGYHGYVVKALNIKGSEVYAYGQVLDHYFIKSDEYTQCRNVIIDKMSIGNLSEGVGTIGGFQALDSVEVMDITINSLQAYNTGPCVMEFDGTNAKLRNISVNNINAHFTAGNAIEIDDHFENVTIGQHLIDTCSTGILVSASAVNVSIGNGMVRGATQYGYAFMCNTLAHGVIQAINCGLGVYRAGDVVLDRHFIRGSIGSMYVVPFTLVNLWVNNGENVMDFQVVMEGPLLYIKGMVKDGTSGLIGTLPVGYRPSRVMTYLTYAITGSLVRTFAHIDIGTDGTVTVSNYSSLGSGSKVAFNIHFEV